jgi:transposase
VTTPTNPSTTPHTVDGLLRVVEEKEAEVAFLKLLVDKLKLQLLRGALRRVQRTARRPSNRPD